MLSRSFGKWFGTQSTTTTSPPIGTAWTKRMEHISPYLSQLHYKCICVCVFCELYKTGIISLIIQKSRTHTSSRWSALLWYVGGVALAEMLPNIIKFLLYNISHGLESWRYGMKPLQELDVCAVFWREQRAGDDDAGGKYLLWKLCRVCVRAGGSCPFWHDR